MITALHAKRSPAARGTASGTESDSDEGPQAEEGANKGDTDEVEHDDVLDDQDKDRVQGFGALDTALADGNFEAAAGILLPSEKRLWGTGV